MKSPTTGKEMELRKEEQTLEFRKEKFKVVYHYYWCETSKQSFTTTELDEINVNQVYNQYRDKHNLPFPDEIRQLREKYDLPATKMSEILGFGVNTYRNYEDGEVPVAANAKLIQLAKNSEIFKELIQMSAELTDAEKEKLIAKVNNAEEVIANSVEHHFEPVLIYHKKGKFSGYRDLSLERFKQMVIYFTEKLEPWTTQLNKLCFYSDFINYRTCGYSISGMNYRAVEMGPVLADYKMLFEYIGETKCVIIQCKTFENGVGEQFKPVKGCRFNKNLFEKHELNTLDLVAKKLGKMKTKEIVDYSHKEKGWKVNEKKHNLISYEYAFEMESIN